MSTYWYLPAILLPAAGGTFAGLFFKNEKAVRVFCGTVTCLTSALAFLLILSGTEGLLEVARFSDRLVFCLDLTGPGRVFASVSASLWPLTALYAFEYMDGDPRFRSFYSFFTLSFGVTLGIALAGNLFTLYCFYEMLTLSTVPLVVHTHTKEASRAGRVYLAMSIGGAAFAFISLVYTVVSGPALPPSAVSRVFWLFGFFGFGVKAAVFPLHFWLPKAAAAPTPVTALLHAAAVVNAGVFAILRLTYEVYGADLLAGTPAQAAALSFVLFTVVYGSFMAVREQHLKRRLAYSTVSNLAYMLFGVLLLTPAGLTAGLMHMVFHSVMKITAFFAIGAVNRHAGIEYLQDAEGLGRRMPVTMACFTVSALALIGIPPFAGFVSKWYLLAAAADAGTPLAFLGMGAVLLSALFTAFYTLVIVRKAFFPAPGAVPARREAGVRMLVPLVLLAFASLACGLAGRYFYNVLAETVSGIPSGQWGGL
ncbi:MAG: proton-conducting membrane transporter [Lachnospiraceae bacterium]|nr:proton-conducting membrane transporter [Lachnospiraceae bacterium]